MLRIGIICPSEIAFRRFMPSLLKLTDITFVGVAVADDKEWPGVNLIVEREKADAFVALYGGIVFTSYSSLINSDIVDAVYLPLPPALHFKWAELALKAGKHVLSEKPATTSFSDTDYLIKLANERELAFHENYMFAFHQQLVDIQSLIASGVIGIVRLYRLSFGFPRRTATDFRYNKALGGGALLDAGGYVIKYASMLLGESTKLVSASSQFTSEFEVDIAGSATLVNENHDVAQIAFGMDNSYKCDLEVWGSSGTLTSGRVLTAPADFVPEAILKIGTETEIRKLNEDDAFMKSIAHFVACISTINLRTSNHNQILQQAKLVQEFMNLTNK